MQLGLTVIDVRDGGERPVEVRAEPHHTLADLLHALALPADDPVHVDGAVCSPEAPVGLPPLLDGASMVLGRPRSTPGTAPGRAPLRVTTTTGPDAGRSLDLTRGRHVIGRGDAASLRPEDEALSREHLALEVDRDGVVVRDLGTTNGTLVEGEPVPGDGVRVRAGSRVRAGHTTFALEARRHRPTRRRPSGHGTLAVNPTPHLPPARPPVRIVIPPEPRAPGRRRIPWAMVILPLPFAGLLALFFGPRMLLFGLLTPLLAIASTLSDRSTSRRDHRVEHAAWTRERARTGSRLTEALTAERRHRHHAAPDASALLDAARGDSARLWERRPGHEEHLALRAGLGPCPALVEVDRGGGERSHPVLEEVPVVVDLREVRVLGVAGPHDVRDRLARHLLGQLVVLHSHHDVRISVVAEDEGWWSPFAGLVHLREHDDLPGSSRATADPETAQAILAGHARITRDRATAQHGPHDGPVGPTLVLVVDGPQRWRTDPGLRTVLAEGGAHDVLAITLADTADDLPHECGAVIALAGDEMRLQVAGFDAAKGVVDGTGPAWARRLTAAMTPLRDATPDASGGGLPTSTRLLDLIGLDPDDPDEIVRAWSRPASGGPVDLDVVVGAGTDGEHRIDLRRDGPHALVAGTTGSGKSELLQSWVASLAARLSPDEMTFVLVDYKGGAAFADCARLPHTVGLLTDLDPEQAERALTSLDAELTRRERILARSGAKDIDDHRGEPLPRLMIIIDEFRMLAEEQPEALAHLMRIAAVGRSLGVHLVLATQRPGGIVSADIRANVNLRIALRVRDRIDSDDVLGTPDAVDLPEEAPGRALARTGGSPAQAFQTGRIAGHAGSATDRVLVRSPGDPWPVDPTAVTPSGPTDLQRLTATITTAAGSLGITPPHRPWLPPLAETITAAEVHDLPAPTADGPAAPFAVVDRPEHQLQETLGWSPTGGHWMVVGGPGTGRTTAIAGIVTAASRAWGPDRLQVQVIGDGSASLAALADIPHVGSVVDGEDLPVTSRFLDRLAEDIAERRRLLRASGHPTLDSWWSAHEAEPTADTPPPHLLLALDGWSRITQPRGGADLGETADILETLLRDGTAAGLRALVAGGREMFSGRISSLMGTRLVLHLPDRGDAALAGLTQAQTATRAVPGRARRQPGGELLQIALPGPPGDATRPGPRPWVVEPLPETTAVLDLPPPDPGALPVGIGGEGRAPVAWRTSGARRALVCGPPRSGRTTTLVTMARQAHAAGHPLAVIGDDLADHAELADCPRVDPEDRDGLIALRRLHPDLAVVADDLDRIEEAPVADVLREILRRLDADRGLVMAATSTQRAATAVRGLVAEVARGRTGVLLQPTSRSDGDALGLRVPPLPRLPGRGYLITDGRAAEMQVARCDAAGGG